MGDVSPLSDFKGLFAVLLALLLMAFLTSGQRQCLKESINILPHIIKNLGNSSDAVLYTPEDFPVRIFYRCCILEVCYGKSLECFLLELNVILQEEIEYKTYQALSKLIRLLGKGQPQRNCTDPHAQCQPCECYPEQPVPFFLTKLHKMLQRSCREQIVPCVAKQRSTCWLLR